MHYCVLKVLHYRCHSGVDHAHDGATDVAKSVNVRGRDYGHDHGVKCADCVERYDDYEVKYGDYEVKYDDYEVKYDDYVEMYVYCVVKYDDCGVMYVCWDVDYGYDCVCVAYADDDDVVLDVVALVVVLAG